MSWKSTIRSIERAARAAEREQKRRERERERLSAEAEVEEYELIREELLTIHHDSGLKVDWDRIQETPSPGEPIETHAHEELARAEFKSYSPSFIDKLFRRSDKKEERLRKAIENAKLDDDIEFQTMQKEYEEWRDLTTTASRILAGDPDAYHHAIENFGPFSEIQDLMFNPRIEFVDSEVARVDIQVHNEEVVPMEEKRVLKSGRLSTKAMPKTRFYGLYQDYVCGSAIRAAGELISLLPLKVILVNVESELLDSSTGHLELRPILSILLPRRTLQELNLRNTDPSDALRNFLHRIDFKKTKGFSPVEVLDLDSMDLETTSQKSPSD